jgi:hypothetical protein
MRVVPEHLNVNACDLEPETGIASASATGTAKKVKQPQ